MPAEQISSPGSLNSFIELHGEELDPKSSLALELYTENLVSIADQLHLTLE